MRPTRGRTLAIVSIYAVWAFRSSVSLVRLRCGPLGDSTRRRALLAVHWQHGSSLRGPAVAMRFTRARTAGRRRRRRACHCHSQCTPGGRPRRIAGRAIRCRCDLPRATRTSQCRSRPTRGRELATWRTQFYFFLGHGVASHLPLFSQPKRNSTSFSFPSRL